MALSFVTTMIGKLDDWKPSRGVTWPSFLPDEAEQARDNESYFTQGVQLRAAQEARESSNASKLETLVWAGRVLRRVHGRTGDESAESMLHELTRFIRETWRVRGEIPQDGVGEWARRRTVNLTACPVGWRRTGRAQ